MALELMFCVGLYAILTILAARFWQHWLFWRKIPNQSRLQIAGGAAISVLAVTVLASIVSTVLYRPFGFPVLNQGNVMWRVTEVYLYNLADAVPGVKLPDALNWTLASNFSTELGRWVLFFFRLLIIVPALDALVKILQPPGEASEA
jgi:hypothetical protein